MACVNCDGLLFCFFFFLFFLCAHMNTIFYSCTGCVCVCVCLLSTESFNTSRQSIVRGAMFGPVSLLKDALHRAVRAKSGEVNKTKPRVPLICCCFFSLPPQPFLFFFIIMIFSPSVLSSSESGSVGEWRHLDADE